MSKSDNSGDVLPSGGPGMLFVDTFTHFLDPKKRLTIPTEWRDQVGEPKSLYVLSGLNGEQCLYVYAAREFAPRLERFRKIGIGDKKARVFARVLASRSNLVTWDTAGRIRIKDELLEYARLTGEVKLVGAINCFELWNPDLFKAAGTVDPATMEDAVRYVDF